MTRALRIAQDLIAGAERARLAGDPLASLFLALRAAEYVALARLADDHPPERTANDRL